MAGLSPIKQVCHPFSTGFFSQIHFPQFEKCKSYICTNPLIDRVTNHWKVILMDCSTIIAVSCCAITFFTGPTILCFAFAIMTVSSGVSAFYMRYFSTLSDVETTVRGLKETKEKLEKVAKDLERENNRLAETNRELQRTNEAFRATNRELQTTNEAFRQTNARLNTQVTELTLQVTQLRESAERIRTEMMHFQQENTHLHNNVQGFDQSLRVLDQQILASRALCEQITNHLTTQQQGLGEQLGQLRQYLSELRAENRVHERIQELGALQHQVQQAASQLHTIQLQYAAERANFQAIHEALVQLRNQFDTAIQDAVSSMQFNNQQFRNHMSVNQQQFQDNINALSVERQRIQQMLNRYQESPSCIIPPTSTQPSRHLVAVRA
jgi:chromosome segregation ATPase